MTMFNWVTLTMVLTFASKVALSAALGGMVKDEAGQGLPGINVCLLPQDYLPGSNQDCLQQQITNDAGNYGFQNVAAGEYVLEVRDARLDAYVWKTPAPRAVLTHVSSAVTGFDLQRQFNFSNFQHELTVTGEHLADLYTFDLAAEPVFLKLYLADPANPDGQKVLFLGRVSDANHLAIKLSLPRSASAISYEIYNSAQTLSGAIPLS